jgi:hypothetical protein
VQNNCGVLLPCSTSSASNLLPVKKGSGLLCSRCHGPEHRALMEMSAPRVALAMEVEEAYYVIA